MIINNLAECQPSTAPSIDKKASLEAPEVQATTCTDTAQVQLPYCVGITHKLFLHYATARLPENLLKLSRKNHIQCTLACTLQEYRTTTLKHLKTIHYKIRTKSFPHESVQSPPELSGDSALKEQMAHCLRGGTKSTFRGGCGFKTIKFRSVRQNIMR